MGGKIVSGPQVPDPSALPSATSGLHAPGCIGAGAGSGRPGRLPIGGGGGADAPTGRPASALRLRGARSSRRSHASGKGPVLVPADVCAVRTGRLDPAGLLVFVESEKEQAARYGSRAGPPGDARPCVGRVRGVAEVFSLCREETGSGA